jgi:PAS domain S-box-containing protein
MSALRAFRELPSALQVYIACVVCTGAALLCLSALTMPAPRPLVFAALVVASCLTSLWKVKLLLSPTSESTLSVSYAADLMALIVLGPQAAMIVAVAGAWTQCTFKVAERYPAYRTVFSMAAEAITMQATGLAFVWLGGVSESITLSALPKPLVGAISTYFLVNTWLVAGAIALSSRKRWWNVWHDNFLWSAPSFVVAGAAGALAAVVVQRGEYWLAILLFAPVYLTYRTYCVFLGRIADQQLHVEEARKLHAEAVEALALARRAERALADEKERLSVTLRSIGDGVITTDLDGRVCLLNRAAEALTGWTQEQATGQPLSAVFQSVDRETGVPANLLGEFRRHPDRPVLPQCTLLAARDRTERPIEESAAPLTDTAGRTIGMVLVFRDISDAIRMQAERARADKLSSLGLLAGGIAHDFNDILMAVMGNVSLARVAVPAGGPIATALAAAEEACVRARHLTWQLLTFSKGGVPVKKPVALPHLLHESARLVLRGSNITCEFDIEPDLWPVEADDTQLVQVFNNILMNAQQAMPHGGHMSVRAENVVERRHRCEYALHAPPGSYVRISVSDTGVGIAREHVGSIFDPYFSTKKGGSGLGLATSHSIVKNHGGFVTVDSTVGSGTAVHVHLPALREAETRQTAPVVKPRARHNGRILVMDDEPTTRTLVVNMLELLGYKPEAVNSGTAAVELYKGALAKGRPFDAVILDLVVPEGMGGRETMERLEQIDRKVVAILASGYANESMTAECQQLGFKAVIPKPYTVDELSKTLHAVMATGSSSVH